MSNNSSGSQGSENNSIPTFHSIPSFLVNRQEAERGGIGGADAPFLGIEVVGTLPHTLDETQGNATEGDEDDAPGCLDAQGFTPQVGKSLGIGEFVLGPGASRTRGAQGQDVLILDDFGLQPLTPEARLALLTLLEDRYEEKSVIITSQLPLDRWYYYIAEPTLDDAIMDRLINSSEHIELKGETLRHNRRRK